MGTRRFIQVIIFAGKKRDLRVEINRLVQGKNTEYPPKINKFEVVCLSMWGLIQKPEPLAR